MHAMQQSAASDAYAQHLSGGEWLVLVGLARECWQAIVSSSRAGGHTTQRAAV
jgi:hypothetical protein